jgi:hypothetical protein
MRYFKTSGIRIAPSTRVKEVLIIPSEPGEVIGELRRAYSVLQREGINARLRRLTAGNETLIIDDEYVARAIMLLLAEGFSASVRK